MVPAPERHHKAYLSGYCKPEWDLLCRVRANIKSILIRPLKGKKISKGEGIVLEQLRIIIANMDETFTDWPENPK